MAKAIATIAIAVFWCISTVGATIGTTVGVTSLAAAVTAATGTAADNRTYLQVQLEYLAA